MMSTSTSTTTWGENEVNQIREKNSELYQSEIGQKMLRMLRHFQGGDRTGPNADSPIWILEILQNAIDAGAKTLRIYHIEGQGFILTHDNFHRPEKGITLREVKAMCNISTTTKSLTSVGFFGIGFKSLFYVFRQVNVATVSAPNGYMILNVGGNLPLERSDLLKSVLPTWSNLPFSQPSIPLLDTSFAFLGCRFQESILAKSVSSFLSSSSLLSSVLKIHGLEDIQYYSVGANTNVPKLLSSQSSMNTFIAQASWSPSDQAYQTLQQLRDLNEPSERNGVNNYVATVSGIFQLPLCNEKMESTNSPDKAFVFCTFPTHDVTGLHFSIDGPLLLDANRLHLRWESGCGEWNTEILTHCIPELICQFATWLPSYLRTITDPQMFRDELHEGINIILSWGSKKRKLDYSETRTIENTLMSVFQSQSNALNALKRRLTEIPFLPICEDMG